MPLPKLRALLKTHHTASSDGRSKKMGGAIKKVMFLGKVTTFVVGLAVILALSVGVASTALAGTGVGATFNLGNTNTVNAVSKLVGSVAGPSLSIDNNSTNASATALDLQVEPGKTPMKVNSGTKVANLNVDQVDGRSANQLTRVAFAQNSPRRTERDTTLETSITTPSAGFLLINATTNVTQNGNNVIGLISVDGGFDDPSLKDLSVDGKEIFTTETVVPVGAGNHTVSFKAFSSIDTTVYEGTTLSALFVPFGAGGELPSAASSASGGAQTPGAGQEGRR